MHTYKREHYTKKSTVQTYEIYSYRWQQPGHCGECGAGFGGELGTENRPMYGETLQTLIPLAL